MKAHIKLDRLHCRVSSIVDIYILQRLYRLDKWLTFEKIANAVLRETHSLIWDWLYDHDKDSLTGAATDSKAARHKQSQNQDPRAGDKNAHTPPEAHTAPSPEGVEGSKPSLDISCNANRLTVRQGSTWRYSCGSSVNCMR